MPPRFFVGIGVGVGAAVVGVFVVKPKVLLLVVVLIGEMIFLSQIENLCLPILFGPKKLHFRKFIKRFHNRPTKFSERTFILFNSSSKFFFAAL